MVQYVTLPNNHRLNIAGRPRVCVRQSRRSDDGEREEAQHGRRHRHCPRRGAHEVHLQVSLLEGFYTVWCPLSRHILQIIFDMFHGSWSDTAATVQPNRQARFQNLNWDEILAP